MGADYADDLALNANIPAQAEPQSSSVLSKKDASKISRLIHIPRQQYLIYWKWCQQTPCEGVGFYWQVVDHVEIWSPW